MRLLWGLALTGVTWMASRMGWLARTLYTETMPRPIHLGQRPMAPQDRAVHARTDAPCPIWSIRRR